MHKSALFATILAATGALSYPAYTNDTSVTVILQDQATELGSQTTFKSVLNRISTVPVGSSGPFSTIDISVGSAAKQDLRCQALDLAGKPIVGVRGANTDITFSDADKGPWTFKQAIEVSQVICDPAFVAISSDANDVRVILQNQATELGSQTVFEDFDNAAELPPVGSSGSFQTVEISVGELVDPALRCKLLDFNGEPIVAVRGANTDITFSDADKGPWTFKSSSEVSGIICDPTFVAASTT